MIALAMGKGVFFDYDFSQLSTRKRAKQKTTRYAGGGN